MVRRSTVVLFVDPGKSRATASDRLMNPQAKWLIERFPDALERHLAGPRFVARLLRCGSCVGQGLKMRHYAACQSALKASIHELQSLVQPFEPAANEHRVTAIAVPVV